MAWLDGMWSGTQLGGPDINDNAMRGSPSSIERQERETSILNNQRAAAAAREREVQDREFKQKKREIDIKYEEMRVRKGEAAANKWYQKEQVKLAKEQLQEERRQFDLTFGEGRRQFDLTFGEGQRQFNEGALQSWTDKALALSRTPKDYFTLMRMQQGVGDNISAIPGLSWAAGSGQQLGSTTFAGNPESNSVQNILTNMNVRAGAPTTAGQPQAAGTDWASQAAQQANNMINARQLNLTDQQKQLYQTAREFAMNPHQAGPGWFEALDPMTRDLLQGAAEDQGLDWASALSRHKRGHWSAGGGSSQAA